MTLRFGSVCSGIEAASVAWGPIGWEAAWFSETAAFPSAVLQHHYPEVTNWTDMRLLAPMIRAGLIEAPEVLCGGTPCQAFSLSGLRESLDDERGQLTLEFVRIADAIDARRDTPCTVLWENVHGVLNTSDNAFGCFLAGLCGEDRPLLPPGRSWTDAGVVLGPRRAIAWRTLDAQYFGLAQRRRRVFVVASARQGFDPASVLFEWESSRRDTPPSRGATQESAPGAQGGIAGGGVVGTLICSGGPNAHGFGDFLSNQSVNSGHLIAYGGNRTGGPLDVAAALLAQPGSGWKGDFETETFVMRQPADSGVRYAHYSANFSRDRITDPAGVNPALTHAYDSCGNLQVHEQRGVRRLTPEECERLQGFPTGYTAVLYNGKPAKDGPRYHAIGNSWAVPCVQWIGVRLHLHLHRLNSRIDATVNSAHT